MRLWHPEMINALPNKYVLNQLRECSIISNEIRKTGKPRNRICIRINDYTVMHFIKYTNFVFVECVNRGMKVNTEALKRVYTNIIESDLNQEGITLEDCLKMEDMTLDKILSEGIYSSWFNGRYFWHNYYNLEEKFDCGMISNEDWEIMTDKIFKRN